MLAFIEYNIENAAEINAHCCSACEWEHNNNHISIHSVTEFSVSTDLLSHLVHVQGPHGWSFVYFHHIGKWKTALWIDYSAANSSEFQGTWRLHVQYLCHSKILISCGWEWELNGNCTVRKQRVKETICDQRHSIIFIASTQLVYALRRWIKKTLILDLLIQDIFQKPEEKLQVPKYVS